MINHLASLGGKGQISDFLTNTPRFSNQRGVANLQQNPNSSRDSVSSSFELFNSILQKAYKKIAFPAINGASQNLPTQSAASQYTLPGSSVDAGAQQASSTILGFIQQRLNADIASGADDQALQDRLQQGLNGFIKGFNEAKDQLQQLGLLTPDLSQQINQTYDLVLGGIDNIAQQLFSGDVAASSELLIAAESAQSSSFSLALTTQDGDQVNIDIFHSSQSSFSARYANQGGVSLLETNQQSLSLGAFNLNVIGELDDEELTAINQLLQDVGNIADDFFAGRLEQAFELAVNLDIDRSELNSLNLELQKTTTVKALAAYESNSQVGLNDNLASPFAELTQLLDNLDNVLAEARKFAEPLLLIDEVASGVSQLITEEKLVENNSTIDLNDFNNMLNQLISQFKL